MRAAPPRTTGNTPLRFLLCLMIGLLTFGLTGPAASADPTAGPDRSTPLPVTVQFTQITPRILVGDEPIQISAALTNTGDEPITDPWIRLQRNQRVSNRAQLQTLDENQPTYSSHMTTETALDTTLQPGATIEVNLSVSRTDLAIYDSGAYPILLNVQGSIDGIEGRVGQGAFTMPRTSSSTAPPLAVSWVLPLIDHPHRGAGPDIFVDDNLAQSISDGGRLATILDAAEKHAAATQLTLVVDPDLLDELAAMTDGYQVQTADGLVDGTGADAATEFLDRLREVVETTPVIATPYADVDSVALTRAGLTQVITDARKHGAQITSDVLETTPITDVAWPADGIMTDATWDVLRQDGVTTALLGGASFGQEDYLESEDGITENAATEMPDGKAVVADPGLTRLLTETPQYVAGPVAAAQRVAAELAMIADQAPQRTRNVLLVPPRNWAPSGQLLDELLTMTTEQSWISPTSFDAITQNDPQDRGPLEYPANMSTRELPAAQLAALQSPLTQISELSTAFNAEDAADALWPARSSVLQAGSSAWRGTDGEAVTRHANAANTQLSELRNQIRIVTPSGGTYTLASSDAPLVFTVENTLPWDVHYRIGIDESRSTGLRADDIGVQTIPAGTRATVQLPTTVERSGSFTVVAQISTPDGKPLGNDVQINVSSSAYGTVALWVTGVAFATLLVLIARRWWRRHLFWAEERRKRAASEELQRLDETGAYEHQHRDREHAEHDVHDTTPRNEDPAR